MFPGRPSTNSTARWTEAAVLMGIRPGVCPCDRQAVRLVVRYKRPPSRPPAIRWADRTVDGLLCSPAVRAAVCQAVYYADGLQPHPRAWQPSSSAANGTLNDRISDEYKEGSTNTLNLLLNLCFPRALNCTLHLLFGKPLLRKSEIVLGVSFGTPNTISAVWLLHSFIPYFCPHRNRQQTMVPLVY